MTETEILFFELIQVALKKRELISKKPTEEEWAAELAIAKKQAVAGFVFEAFETLNNQGLRPPRSTLYDWIGLSVQIRNYNKTVSERCKELESLFRTNGFSCCVLKGQGTALYYDDPACRQSGDIDVWVTTDEKKGEAEKRNHVLSFVKEMGHHVGHVDIKHSDVAFFEDVPVEVHFLPSWMFSPFKNKRLQVFFNNQEEKQFGNYDNEVGFTHTTVDFDLVYSLVHIYRHVFEEGIGLRQLLDYYHILLHSDKQQRDDAFVFLKELGMSKFVGGVIYVLHECFKLDKEFFICEPNERHGRFLLTEILVAGNFGHYDSRLIRRTRDDRFSNGLMTLKRDMRYLCYYPSEVLWMPFWKVWHWCWRKSKGFL